ncbi:MAG: alpha/beta hydrolase [Terracidiphilus sp.]
MNLGGFAGPQGFRDMARKNHPIEILSRHGAPAANRSAHPVVSGRWLLVALGVVIAAAVACAWGALCLLFWQGAWQLLYRPTSAVTHTPAVAGLKYEPVEFAVTETGSTRLRGWWIPAAPKAGSARYTVLYLHGRVGNLGDSVNALAGIHAAGANVFAFDYRGYGQSEFVRPNEAHWRQDADWALDYLTDTRQIGASSIVLAGSKLGANLALEVAAAHPELGGVVLDAPMNAPLDLVFNDARAHLVPARLLFHDRYGMQEPAAGLRIPSLWILAAGVSAGAANQPRVMAAYGAVTAPKVRAPAAGRGGLGSLRKWLAGLNSHRPVTD